MSGTLDNVTSWIPSYETPEEIANDAVNLIASTTINGVAYGIASAFYFVCLYALIQQYRAGKQRKQAVFLLAYISVMFVLGTVYCADNSRVIQLAYVNYRNFPGGPFDYTLYIFSIPLSVSGVAAFWITSWMNDALLVWRLWVLYRGTRFLALVTALSVIMYLATFSMGMVTLIEAVLPTQSLWSAIAVKFVLASYAMSTAFTAAITGLMISRILLARRAFERATGQQGSGSQYLSIAAMLIESSALYTIWGIIFMVLYIVNHPVQYVFLASLSEVQIIAPLLIIYRVSIGRAWQSDTNRSLTEVVFNPGQGSGSSAFTSSNAPERVAGDTIHVVIEGKNTTEENLFHKEIYGGLS